MAGKAIVVKRKYCFVDFTKCEVPPTFSAAQAIATAADNQVDHVFINGSLYWEYIQEAASAAVFFTKDGVGYTYQSATVKGGWILPIDNTDNDGLEFSHGVTADVSWGHMKVGTDPAFFIRLIAAIPTVSEFDVFLFGWRKVAAYTAGITQPTTGAAGPDAYTDFFAFNVNAGDIYIDSNLNNAGLVAVDTTLNWADGAVHEMLIKVSGAGAATGFIDGTALATTQAFTFDTGDVLMPLFAVTRGAATAAVNPNLIQYEWGPQ
jgi:hypothetical protein